MDQIYSVVDENNKYELICTPVLGLTRTFKVYYMPIPEKPLTSKDIKKLSGGDVLTEADVLRE